MGAVCILVAHEHYSVDVVVAYFITTRLFYWYHTMANLQVHISVIRNNRDASLRLLLNEDFGGLPVILKYILVRIFGSIFILHVDLFDLQPHVDNYKHTHLKPQRSSQLKLQFRFRVSLKPRQQKGPKPFTVSVYMTQYTENIQIH